MLARSGIPVVRTLFTEKSFTPFLFLPMSNDNLEQETLVDDNPVPVETSEVDTGAKVANDAMNDPAVSENINVPLTNGDMGFISDMLSGAKTPGCLINIGNFINSFVGLVTAYQDGLAKIEQKQNAEYLALAKEFFVLDAQDRPTMNEESNTYKLVEGKTQDDLQDYNTRTTNITTHFTKEKNDLANEVHIISVTHDVLWNFKHSFLYDVSIELAQKSMNIKPENSGNFVAILYSITQKVHSL